jgi:hypothetical protein
MIVNFETHTDGKGLWSEEARMVLITKLDIGYSSLKYYPEEPFFGELRAYFEPSGFTAGSWNTQAFGLIYTDKLWMKEFKKALRGLGFSIKAVQNVSYSEQGMQGTDYVSMDVRAPFYASWKRMLREQQFSNVNTEVRSMRKTGSLEDLMANGG